MKLCMSGNQAMIYPPGFANLDQEQRAKFLAAPCGPGKGVISWIVPEDLFGLDVRQCCAVHDYSYSRGKTKSDKIEADITFLHNLLFCVITGRARMKSRATLAIIYYLAVRFFGGCAYKR